jgi:hypothetical protein
MLARRFPVAGGNDIFFEAQSKMLRTAKPRQG